MEKLFFRVNVPSQNWSIRKLPKLLIIVQKHFEKEIQAVFLSKYTEKELIGCWNRLAN